ncbi:hypothetical protein [Nostoc sp. ChiQUE01b]|uniref:hypothetical protein n=1 Tax=Nostoc sp. ChiQUE01b TaxID=3075376 RepID=UPI002AD4C816|nr:hypothetical protein [Nostoc sp. ChiQUE01b]MDZ8260604.1 hypothetical protein [Nostoc sp. ChiQUE01b]
MINLKLERFTEWATGVCGKSPARQLGEYIATNQGKNLDAIVEECFKDDSLKSYIPKFAQAVNEVHRRNVSGLSIDLGLETGELGVDVPQKAKYFKLKCKQELIEKALAQNIPVATREYAGANANSEGFNEKFLNLKEIDEASAIKEYLKWINCVAEFHCGEQLFEYKREQKQQDLTLDTKSSSKNLKDERITLKELAQQEQSENLLYDLWEQGYLQCNIR